MHSENLDRWQHDHVFNQDQKRPGESRTLIVIAITTLMMCVEIATGIMYGSMALFADGLHMASHAVALAINAFAYVYARRHADNPRFSFGTGKVNSLGGFAGAVLLGVFALMMAAESVERLINPVTIAYNQAVLVAVIGLVVNGASVFILGVHDHGHDHSHDDGSHHHHHEHDHGHDHGHGHDHNLRSAYLHVLADALTSLLAIFALLAAKYYGFVWMDPLVGIAGAILVTKWSVGLLRSTSHVLLDTQGPDHVSSQIRQHIEERGDSRVTDLHVWTIAPGQYAAIISVVSHEPETPEFYKENLPTNLGLAHVTVEIHTCEDEWVEV